MSPTPDTATAVRDGVTVKRTLRREPNGVVARFEVRAPDPAVVRVIDEFPSSLSVAAAGFEHDAAPDKGRIEDGRVVASVTVADGTAAFVCGASLRGAPPDVDPGAPTIEGIEELEFVQSTDGGPHPTADGGRPGAEAESRTRTAPADDARPTTATVDTHLDGLAERTAELSEAFETGDPAGDLHDRVDIIEAGLEVVAGDVRSVRSGLASVEERLAELERFRVATSPRGSDEDDDPTAALPEPPAADRPSVFDDR